MKNIIKNSQTITNILDRGEIEIEVSNWIEKTRIEAGELMVKRVV